MLPIDYSGLVQRETQLPGLAYLLDSRLLMASLERFNSQTAVELNPSSEFVDVAVNYVRYKPQRRAMALLEAITSSGSRRLFVGTARTAQGWQKYLDTGQATNAERTGAILDAPNRVSLEPFPHDRKLSAIAKLHHPETRTKVIQRTLGSDMETSNDSLQTLAYKPGRRFVASVRNSEQHSVLRFFTSNGFSSIAGRLRRADQMRLLDFRILNICPRYCSIAIDWQRGDMLAASLQHESFPYTQIEQVGEHLSRWHKLGMANGNSGLPTHDAHTLESLSELGQDLQWLNPNLKNSLEHFTQNLFLRLSRLPVCLSPIHGDFYAKQVIVHNNSIRFIDLDEFALGDPYQDVGNFVAQLYWNVIRGVFDKSHADQAAQMFIDAYERTTSSPQPNRLSVHVAAGIMRCMPHAFRRGLPNWQHAMHTMLEWADSWLNYDPPKPTVCVEKEIPWTSLDVNSVTRELDSRDCSISEELRHCQVVRATVRRHKPGRRMLVEYEVHHPSGNHSAIRVLGKVRLNKNLDVRVPRLQQQLWNSGLYAPFRTRVPKVLAILPRLQLWVQELVPCSSIDPALRHSAQSHFRAGISLADLHRTDVHIPRYHGIEQELSILQRLFCDLVQEYPDLKDKIRDVQTVCRCLGDSLNGKRQCFIHRDFYFDQVLVTEDSVTIVDLDLACLGPPELDIGNYMAHLDEYGLRNVRLAEPCKEYAVAFLLGYLAEAPDIDLTEISKWRTLSLARHIALSTRYTDRRHTTMPLIEKVLREAHVALIPECAKKNLSSPEARRDLLSKANQPIRVSD